MASTVLRVKRRLADNPQDALVVLCKRVKTDTEEISPSLFVFRGTVDNQEVSHVNNIVPKSDIKLKAPKNVSDIIQKLRQDRKTHSTDNRYEIVNCSRGIKESDENLFHLVDIQKKDDEKHDAEYIYDIYTAAKKDIYDSDIIDNLISIENIQTELIYDQGDIPTSDEDEDDDSNDENNWRNDYPDSEPSSIDEEDMMRAMQRCNIDDDLSSDTGEDKIYDDPPDLFNEDVKRYGEAYAKYKARVVAETDPSNLNDSKNLVHCIKIKELDEESVEGYKGDSDDGFYYGQEEDSEQFREQYEQESSDEYSPD